jgi:hypothetical protein
VVAAVDVVARVVAIIGVALAFIIAIAGLLTYWRNRQSLSVVLRPLATAPQDSNAPGYTDVALIEVVSNGRSLSVEKVDFEWADTYPAPSGLSVKPAKTNALGLPPGTAFAAGAHFGWDTPSLPVRLARGLSQSFGYFLSTSDGSWVHPSEGGIPGGVNVRALVTVSGGKVHRSNPARLHLGPYLTPMQEA